MSINKFCKTKKNKRKGVVTMEIQGLINLKDFCHLKFSNLIEFS